MKSIRNAVLVSFGLIAVLWWAVQPPVLAPKPGAPIASRTHEQCPAGSRLDGGRCVCLEGSQWDGTACTSAMPAKP